MPEEVWGRALGGTSVDPGLDAVRALQQGVDLAPELFALRRFADPALHQDDHRLAVILVDREGGDVAAPQVGQLLRRPFQVLRPDVAAVEDDEVLGAAGDHDLVVEQVAEVAGLQPAVGAQHLGGHLGLLVIAAHDARAAEEDVAHAALRQHAAGIVANLERVALQRVAAGDEGAGFGPLAPGTARLRCASASRSISSTT